MVILRIELLSLLEGVSGLLKLLAHVAVEAGLEGPVHGLLPCPFLLDTLGQVGGWTRRRTNENP